MKGQVDLDVKYNGKEVFHKFYVTDSQSSNLCGRDLMKKLGICLTGIDSSSRVNSIDSGPYLGRRSGGGA